MARQVFYTSREERQAAKDGMARNEYIRHDDYNVGPNGENRLTIEIYTPIPPDPAELRRQALKAIFAARSATIGDIQEALELLL